MMKQPPCNTVWTTVSRKVGRSVDDCQKRWKLCLSPAINNSSWTMQEDINLLKGYVIWGHSSFQNVVNGVISSLGVRTPDHCDDRLKRMMNGNPTRSAAKKLLEMLEGQKVAEKAAGLVITNGNVGNKNSDSAESNAGNLESFGNKRVKFDESTKDETGVQKSVPDSTSFTNYVQGVSLIVDNYDCGESLTLVAHNYYAEELAQGVQSDDPALQLEATTLFRKLLSAEHNPPIDVVIEAGVVPKFVEFLGRLEMPKLQFEAAAALTYVALGTSKHTQVVISHQAVPLFVQLLSFGCDDVKEQAVIALGAVAGDSSCRDLVLAQGALKPLMDLVTGYSKLSMLRRAAWTLSYFCRGTPFVEVKAALPVLKRLLSLDDEEVLTDACRALSYLSESSNGTSDHIQGWIEGCVWEKLVNLLLIPALQMVGNIVTGDDYQNQAVLDAHIIKPLVQLLQHAKFDIKKEAARAISEATSRGSHAQIQFLVTQGCIKPLCDLLICLEPSIVISCLQGLENILKVGEADKINKINRFAEMIDGYGGSEKIENLQKHENNEIKDMAVKMFERYRDAEKDKEHNLQRQGYIFGGNQPTVPPAG